MKAIIVKDNTFQTIGFEVSQGNITLLIWGVSPHSLVFVKEVEVKEWAKEIFELVRIQSTISERERFVQNFYEVVSQKVDTNETCFNFTTYKEETNRMREKFDNIVKNII